MEEMSLEETRSLDADIPNSQEASGLNCRDGRRRGWNGKGNRSGDVKSGRVAEGQRNAYMPLALQ